jgi:hypothetical protein
MSGAMRWIVPLFALALGACTGNVDDCYNTVERSYTVSLPADADAPLEYAVETCRADAEQCPNVCAAILMRQQIQSLFPATCDVRFTAAEAKVKMTYQVEKPGCAVPVDEPGSNF